MGLKLDKKLNSHQKNLLALNEGSISSIIEIIKLCKENNRDPLYYLKNEKGESLFFLIISSHKFDLFKEIYSVIEPILSEENKQNFEDFLSTKELVSLAKEESSEENKSLIFFLEENKSARNYILRKKDPEIMKLKNFIKDKLKEEIEKDKQELIEKNKKIVDKIKIEEQEKQEEQAQYEKQEEATPYDGRKDIDIENIKKHPQGNRLTATYLPRTPFEDSQRLQRQLRHNSQRYYGKNNQYSFYSPHSHPDLEVMPEFNDNNIERMPGGPNFT